jgi:SnoaL-like domain
MSLEEQLAALTAQVTALADQVTGLTAREEIRDLLCRYGFAADTGSAREWSETYAPDGVYENIAGTMTGRASFAQAIDDPDGVHKQQIESHGSLHTHGPIMIRVSGNEAWAEGPTLVWTREEQGWRPFALSYNHWDLRRRAGRWEVSRRLSRPVAPAQAREVLTAWRTAVDISPAPAV